MEDNYLYAIAALLPLAALMVVFEVNPYHALVIRGILGAVAALVYAMFGAADVALTEALVGTMLAITLYAVAVRSSLVMRLGVLKNELGDADSDRLFDQLIDRFRDIFREHYMRVELVPYQNTDELKQALIDKEVHAICTQQASQPVPPESDELDKDWNVGEAIEPLYQTTTRLQRLYDIMQAELMMPATSLIYINVTKSEEKH